MRVFELRGEELTDTVLRSEEKARRKVGERGRKCGESRKQERVEFPRRRFTTHRHSLFAVVCALGPL